MFNLTWITALSGCAVLLWFWYRFRHAGARSGVLALIGCALLLGAVLVVSGPVQVANLAGVLVAFLIVLGLLSCSFLVGRVRRRPNYRVYKVPTALAGRCASCGKIKGNLRQTEHGQACMDCRNELALTRDWEERRR